MGLLAAVGDLRALLPPELADHARALLRELLAALASTVDALIDRLASAR